MMSLVGTKRRPQPLEVILAGMFMPDYLMMHRFLEVKTWGVVILRLRLDWLPALSLIQMTLFLPY